VAALASFTVTHFNQAPSKDWAWAKAEIAAGRSVNFRVKSNSNQNTASALCKRPKNCVDRRWLGAKQAPLSVTEGASQEFDLTPEIE
jgi:hypothetical protein